MTMSAASKAGPEQLVLDLAHRQALGAEDFLVSASNAAAIDIVDRWPDWPDAWTYRAVIVSGPAGAGKTHLVNVWRQRSGARIIAAKDVSEADVTAAPAETALAVEDLDRGIGDEAALFHLLNLAREKRLSLLLTSRLAPGDLEVPLPDLRSRLRALTHVAIEPPDTSLLKALLVKLLDDRQLGVEPHVVEHLALHMERSTATAERLVAEIDRLQLASRRKLSRALAAEALARIAREED